MYQQVYFCWYWYISIQISERVVIALEATYRDTPEWVWPGGTWRSPPPAVPSLSAGCRRCSSWSRTPRYPCPGCRTLAHCCGSPRLKMWQENVTGIVVIKSQNRKTGPWGIHRSVMLALRHLVPCEAADEAERHSDWQNYSWRSFQEKLFWDIKKIIF